VTNWAVVVGVDRYWSDAAHLKGAVRDAFAMREWLLDPAGGDVPADNLQLVLAPGPNGAQPEADVEWVLGTKANIIVAINDLMQLSGGQGERLYFYFAGHGLTARVSNRDESALLATDFTSINTDNSIALRSLWEYFETTQFADQFFFVDACRNVPPWGEGAEFELGRWTLPRSRDPGMSPVQQFILYATSPKLKATEVRDVPGEEHGAFTAALLDGVRGAGPAKAWSWERRCYEVRWERFADYVKRRVEREKRQVAESEQGALLQIPQDSGSRGVADRERDVVVTSFPLAGFARERLEVLLQPDSAYPDADVRVLDAIGDVVASQVGGTGTSVVFTVPPGTYGVRASAPEIGAGRMKAPVELYEPLEKPVEIALRPVEESAEEVAAEEAAPPAEKLEPQTVAVRSADPLSIVEVKDETGRVVDVRRAEAGLELQPGFYRVRHVGPNAVSKARSVVVEHGDAVKPVRLSAGKPSPATVELLESMGGRVRSDNTVELDGLGRAAWAETSTLVAAAVGNALNGEHGPVSLGLRPAGRGRPRSGIAVYLVSEADRLDPRRLEIRVWRAGLPVPEEPSRVRRVGPRLLELSVPADAGRHWVSIHRERQGRPMVFAPTVLAERVAVLVLQVTAGLRIFQYQPAAAGGPAAAPDVLRRAEYLERMLLSGRLDGARELVGALAVTDDPFLGCLSGYVLLRLGLMDELAAVAERVTQMAPQLSDGFVLRGEHAAATGGSAAKQAFAEAAAAGVPVFAEGLTRLLEGLRVHEIVHPGAAIVRYVFQNHMRGSMWSVFAPRRFESGSLVVTAADLGYEA